jgi:hypothetical protein
MDLTPEQKTEYFKRSFVAADGLWFMKAEEEYGFDTALELDRRVWEVVAKIQARCLKKWHPEQSEGVDALKACLETKLAMEGYDATVERESEGEPLVVTVRGCPWHRKMVDAGREGLAERVGRAICPAEFGAWAREFGLSCSVRVDSCLCGGQTRCSMVFVAEGPG